MRSGLATTDCMHAAALLRPVEVSWGSSGGFAIFKGRKTYTRTRAEGWGGGGRGAIKPIGTLRRLRYIAFRRWRTPFIVAPTTTTTRKQRRKRISAGWCFWPSVCGNLIVFTDWLFSESVKSIQCNSSNKPKVIRRRTLESTHAIQLSMKHPFQYTGEWVNNRGWTGDRTPSFLCCYYIIIVIIIDVVVNICITGWRRISSSSLTSIMQR